MSFNDELSYCEFEGFPAKAYEQKKSQGKGHGFLPGLSFSCLAAASLP
jgi:hypothetical protein